MKKVGLVVAVMAACAAGSAVAQQGFYVGGSLGQSMTSFNGTDFTPSAGETMSLEKNKTAYKLFGGYSLNQYFAVEGGFVDLGKPVAKFTNGAGATSKLSEDESAFFIAGKGTLPLTEQFNLFGKLGLSQNRTKASSSDGNSASKSRSDVLYGIGAEYNVTKQVGIRLEYESYGNFGSAFDFNNNTGSGRTKTDMWSLGAAYKF